MLGDKTWKMDARRSDYNGLIVTQWHLNRNEKLRSFNGANRETKYMDDGGERPYLMFDLESRHR